MELQLEYNGNILSNGEPYKKAYQNTENGRKELKEELEQPYLSSVLAMWGDAATIFYNEKKGEQS